VQVAAMVVQWQAFAYSEFVDTKTTDQITARAAACAETPRLRLRLHLLRLARS
jgi:hypothetical protein